MSEENQTPQEQLEGAKETIVVTFGFVPNRPVLVGVDVNVDADEWADKLQDGLIELTDMLEQMYGPDTLARFKSKLRQN